MGTVLCVLLLHLTVYIVYMGIVVRVKPVTKLVILITHCEIGITPNELNHPFHWGHNGTLSPVPLI